MRIIDTPKRVQAVLLAESDAERNELADLLDDREWRLLADFFDHMAKVVRAEREGRPGALL